jgi:hypothetical protein
MASSQIPETLRRFVLTSVPSVPFVEALLLFRDQRDKALDTAFVARRLYIGQAAAAEIVTQLVAARIVHAVDAVARSYRYTPETSELAAHLDTLARYYASHLVAVTDMIHSNRARSAKQFADAFKVRKE